MTHFNLNDLRADATCYAPAHHRDDHRFIIDFLVEALIGFDHHFLMITHPNSLIVFKPITENVKDGQYLCMYHTHTK